MSPMISMPALRARALIELPLDGIESVAQRHVHVFVMREVRNHLLARDAQVHLHLEVAALLVVLAQFAIGSVAHFTIRGAVPSSTGGMWADVLVTASVTGLAGVVLWRKLILRGAAVKQV